MSELTEELTEVVYEVTLYVRESVPSPTEEEIQKAIYRGCEALDTEDAVEVRRH